VIAAAGFVLKHDLEFASNPDKIHLTSELIPLLGRPYTSTAFSVGNGDGATKQRKDSSAASSVADGPILITSLPSKPPASSL